jgi:hypothetical protein
MHYLIVTHEIVSPWTSKGLVTLKPTQIEKIPQYSMYM